MPRMNGIEAARKLHQIYPGLPIILNTLHASVIRSMSSLPEGVTEVVAKDEDLLDCVSKLLPMGVMKVPAIGSIGETAFKQPAVNRRKGSFPI